jgi:hypothetical protein
MEGNDFKRLKNDKGHRNISHFGSLLLRKIVKMVEMKTI